MLQNFTKAVRDLQHTFGNALNPYRPELYYMRGPGPACRAKAARNAPFPATARRAGDRLCRADQSARVNSLAHLGFKTRNHATSLRNS